ncbi:hypothetical protein JOC70_000064 [Clostridium pascui]|nr:hypothetical protein [Clostridium pascui]
MIENILNIVKYYVIGVKKFSDSVMYLGIY